MLGHSVETLLVGFAERPAATAGNRHDGDTAAAGRVVGLDHGAAAKLMGHLCHCVGGQAR